MGSARRVARAFSGEMKSQFRGVAGAARTAGQSTANSFIDPILQKAAKLKAQIAAGLKTPEQAIRARQRIVTSLQTEIELLVRKHKLSAANLAELKRATLELERQKNALAGLPDVTNRTIGAMRFAGTASRGGSVSRISKASAAVDPLVLQSMRKYGLLEGEAARQADKLAAAQKKQSEEFLAASAEASRARRALQGVGGASAAAGEKSAVAGIKFGSAALQLKNEGQSAEQAASNLRRLGATQTEAAMAVRAAYGQMGTAAVTKVKSLNDTLRNSVGTLRTLRILSYSTLGLLAVGFYVEEWSRLVQWLKNATLAMGGFDAALRQMNADAEQASLTTYFAGGNVSHLLYEASLHAKTLADYQKQQLHINLQLAENASNRAIKTHNEIAAFERYKQLQKDVAQLAGEQSAHEAGIAPLLQEDISKIGALKAQYKDFSDLRKLSAKQYQDLIKRTDALVLKGGASKAIEQAQTAINVARLTAQKKADAASAKGKKNLREILNWLYRIRAADKSLTFSGLIHSLNMANVLMSGLAKQSKALFQELGVPASAASPFGAIRYQHVKGYKHISHVSNAIPGLVTTAEAQREAKRYNQIYDQLQGEILSTTQQTLAKLKLDYDLDLARYQQMNISKEQVAKLSAERRILYEDQVAKVQEDNAKKSEQLARQQADRIFAVLSGTSRNLGQAFSQMARSIALAPFQKIFERMFMGVFEQMNSMLGRLGGVFGSASNGRTPGIFPSSASGGGLFSKIAHSVGASLGVNIPGQTGLGLGTMNVAATTVYLNAAAIAGAGAGGGLLSGVLGGKGGFGSLLSGLPLGHGLSSLLGIAAPSGGGGLSYSLLNNLPFGNIGKSASGLGGFGKFLGSAGALLGGAGLLAASIFGGTGHTFGGTLSGAAGGAMIGSMFGPIGTAIGAAAGAIAGFFGHRDNTAGFVKHINEAMRRQRITLPPSETFRFAEGANLASTFSHTYSQSGSTFSRVGLRANTPFWAHPIVGTPAGWRAQQQWNQIMSHFQSGLPFFGSGTNPFTSSQYGMPWGLFGLGPNGLYGGGNPLHWGSGLSFGPNGNLYGSGGGNVTVNSNIALHVPGYVDESGLKKVAEKIAPIIARHVSTQVTSSSSGLGRAIRLGAYGRGF